MSGASDFDRISEREAGLQRRLTAGQMSMIAIGGAIGTGLFMGSAYAIGYAGPSVLVSYAIGALITLLLMGCLAEMTVAHSTSGSFGAYAEFYISPLAGFLVRYAYWAAIVLAVGAEVTAALSPGTTVTAEGHIACGICYQCRTGLAHICRKVKIIGVRTHLEIWDPNTLAAEEAKTEGGGHA